MTGYSISWSSIGELRRDPLHKNASRAKPACGLENALEQMLRGYLIGVLPNGQVPQNKSFPMMVLQKYDLVSRQGVFVYCCVDMHSFRERPLLRLPTGTSEQRRTSVLQTWSLVSCSIRSLFRTTPVRSMPPIRTKNAPRMRCPVETRAPNLSRITRNRALQLGRQQKPCINVR